ncbi:MAG TPA: pyruvate kinase [Tepidiformaceae bacterium]|jgi:pyruvate kinase
MVTPSRSASVRPAGSNHRPARLRRISSFSLPQALDHVEQGDRVLIDDGRISAEVIAKRPDGLELVVVAPADAPVRLQGEKGLNFPDSTLRLGALTDDDRAALPVVARLADAVAISFVHRPEDIADVWTELVRLGRSDIGVIAKIENKEAVHNLVRILLVGLTLPAFGVMIARGDLAVEVGFENLAVVQEDILCLCEAAHVPVIWATQVLESLARTGLPARAEITDATTAQRVECVMLNKGSHILQAVEIQSLLLSTADRHRIKKREVFREFTDQSGVFEGV